MKQQDRVVIVTGGARGIGRGMVVYLLTTGHRVVIADLDVAAGELLTGYLEAGESLRFIATDVRSEESVRTCIDETLAQFGAIDGLVNNAGIASPGSTPVAELPVEEWQNMLATNLTGPFLMAKHAAAPLQEAGGAIVNISSTRALQSEPHTEAYSASKGGLVALTHALAVSLGPRVRVNCILPGWIDVRGSGDGAEVAPLSEADHRQHPVGRVGLPADIAALTVFLLGRDAGFITGQSFVVDGGMTRKMIYHC